MEEIESNHIFTAKRKLDITIPAWRKDLVNGLLSIEELYEDFGSTNYGIKLVDSILKGLDFPERVKGEGYAAITMANSLKRQKKFGLKYNQ